MMLNRLHDTLELEMLLTGPYEDSGDEEPIVFGRMEVDLQTGEVSIAPLPEGDPV